MVIDISGGRFGPVSLGAQDVQSIRQASSRDSIGNVFSRAWDKIADWFCDTNRTEAKKCLFDLYSETTTHGRKVESFLALKEMAGANYQNRFQIEEDDDGVRYTLDLAEEQCPGFSLSFQKIPVDQDMLGRDLNRDDYWGCNGVGSARHQVEVDIGRAGYSVSGVPLRDGTPEDRMAQFDEALAAIGVTDSQREALMEVCNQAVLGNFMKATDFANAPWAQSVRYDVRMVEGELRVRVVCDKDLDLVKPGDEPDPDLRLEKLDMVLNGGEGACYKSQKMQLDLRIVDGDPRARIDIVDTRHLVSRDHDTIR